jgi:O-antigen/teichoic acid export membrane protein
VLVFAVAFGQWRILDPERRLLFYILLARVLLQTFSQAAMAVFKARERMEYVALQQGINSLVVLSWVAACLVFGKGLAIVLIGLVAGQLAETLLGWLALARLLPAPRFFKWEREQWVRTITGCLPIGLTAILLALNLRLDVLVLSRYATSHTLGQFNAAAWFLIAGFLTASLLMSVMFPRLSRLLADNSEKAGEFVLSLLKNSVLGVGFVALLLWICAPALVVFLFGDDFMPAADSLRILSPALPLAFLNTVFFYVFAAARRRFVCLVTLGTGLAIGACLSFYLTSRYGPGGCAAAAVLRELMISSAYLFFLIRGNHARIAGFALLKVLLGATAVLALAAFLTLRLHLEHLWWAGWMVLVLAGTMGVMGVPRVAELRLLADDRI